MATALEKRESRPGLGIILLVSALCRVSARVGIGAYKAHRATEKVAEVPVGDLAHEQRTEAGSYVETSAILHVVARDELPLDADTVVRASGVTLYGVDAVPQIVGRV